MGLQSPLSFVFTQCATLLKGPLILMGWRLFSCAINRANSSSLWYYLFNMSCVCLCKSSIILQMDIREHASQIPILEKVNDLKLAISPANSPWKCHVKSNRFRFPSVRVSLFPAPQSHFALSLFFSTASDGIQYYSSSFRLSMREIDPEAE